MSESTKDSQTEAGAPIVCPQCGHPFSSPTPKPLAKPTAREFRCIECQQPIVGELFLFGGQFACRDCVVRYNQLFGSSESDIATDLRQRANEASRVLRGRRR